MKTMTSTFRIPIYVTISYQTNTQAEQILEEIENALENVEYVMGVDMDCKEEVN